MILSYSNLFYDQLRLLRRVTFRKGFNWLGIQAGFLASRISRRAIVWAHPFSVSAETAAICNLKCPECMAGTGQTLRGNALMDVEMFGNIISRHASHSFFANLYFQGEPFLNKNLHLMIGKAHAKGYYTCLSTNGHFLDEQRCRQVIEAGLDRIIISLDGLTQESYSFYRRGGLHQKVVDGIRVMSELRDNLGARHPLIELQFLVNRQNIGEVPMLRTFCKDLGADIVTLKSMQVYGETAGNEFLPNQKKFNRYYPSGNSEKQKTKKPCYRLWSHAVYTSDGLAVPCCYDKIPEYPMNTANKKPGEFWFSPGMNAFRQKVIDNRSGQSICTNCSG